MTPELQQAALIRSKLGYLPRDISAYNQTKALAAKLAGEPATATTNTATGTQPVSGPGWSGRTCSAGCTPDDSNGAVGPTRYVEIVNAEMGIYDRSGTDLMGASADHSLNTLTGDKNGLSDPIALWDPNTNRFYFEVLDVTSYDTEWGFSKTDSPRNFSDWCTYNTDFGYGAASTLPDYPKMGQTTDFLLLGVNEYGAASANFSDLDWIAKPQVGTGAVTSCPTAGSIATGKFTDLLDSSGAPAWTPVPAIQTDPSGTGYVVASYDVGGTTGGDIVGQLPQASYVSTYRVGKAADGTPTLSTANTVNVSTYQSPADAIQDSYPNPIDTLDGRLEKAVSGVDPLHGNKTAIWTSHAVFGGAGAEERWYEIDPTASTPLQSGVETNSSLFAFNGAISPDRAVNGGTARFGGTMFMTFTTVGTSQDPAVNMVDKYGDNPESGWVTVQTSPGPDDDFSCTPGYYIGVPYEAKCRWGDYSGATPDPTPNVPTGASIGSVWMTNEYVVGSTDPTSPTGLGGVTQLTWSFQGLAATQPSTQTPEAPWMPLVPLTGFGIAATALVLRRRRA